MSDAPQITDRKALEWHRAKAVNQPAFFLHEEAAVEIEERLSEVNKTFTSPVLVGHVTPPLLSLFPKSEVIDDTDHLLITHQNHDLVVHAFGLHWANDPVGQLVQSRLCLQPDGLFMGVTFGGLTLHELRSSIAEAEIQLTGGLSPRVLPMADVRDLGGLLQRAGFALPVADSRRLKVRYERLADLVRDLRGMGENNALLERRRAMTPRTLFDLAEKIYQKHYTEDGYLVATFELVFLTGWAPADDQPKPLRPGSAQHRLSDALGVSETPLKRE